MTHFVVIGAGQAAASLIAKLRAEGFDGDITLIGAEPVPPYQRPPLSKGYLLGEMGEERLYLRSDEWYRDQNITLKTNTRATEVDAYARTVTLSDGDVLNYDKLALTTGAHPRTLPAAIGGMLDGVFTVRDLQDIDRMSPYFAPGKRLLIVGGGYIGLEAAAVAAKKGLEVTLVEMADRILQRVACRETSDYFRNLHTSHGVRILEGTGLTRLNGDEAVESATLSDGTDLPVDFVIAGIGIIPATALGESAGANTDNGIVTDIHCQTSEPNLYAAGDCATCHFNGQEIRLESVGNAIDMGEVAALNMMGKTTEYQPQPWFWSDQYDCKLQIAGLNMGYDRVYVRTVGDAVSHWYYAGDTLLAVDAMNDPRTYMVAKRLIEAGKSPAPEVVTNPETNLKDLLRA